MAPSSGPGVDGVVCLLWSITVDNRLEDSISRKDLRVHIFCLESTYIIQIKFGLTIEMGLHNLARLAHTG